MANETETSGSGSSQYIHGGKLKKLVILSCENHVFRVDKDRLVIGSVVSADVRLPGQGVAPIHAVIEVQQGTATIFDLASESGILVNGSKVFTQVLKPGDEVTIGFYKLKFQLADLEPKASTSRASIVNPEEDLAPLMLTEERGIEQIFDYRPSETKRAIEVVMSWYGTVLSVEHFVDAKKITLGTSRKANFGIPPLLGKPEYAIVSLEGGNYELHVDRSMKGVIQSKGSLKNLTRNSGELNVAFERDDFAKVSIGDVDFYLSFTAAPPRVKGGRLVEKDPFFFKIFISSLALTALLLTAIIRASVPQTLEAEQIPERIATILYQPEKYTYIQKRDAVAVDVGKTEQPISVPVKPEPQKTAKLEITPNPKLDKSKPLPKELNLGKSQVGKNKAKTKGANNSRKQDMAKEGEGARAKGTEGSRGSKKAALGKDQQTAAMRPSPEGGRGRGGGQSQVQDIGNVDLLKGAESRIQNILGDTAAHLGKSGEKLKGFGGFNTLGNGGLALSGTGSGGGGTAETTLGGLSNKGTGGGKIGTGKGAAGSGSAIVGGSSRVELRSGGPEETIVMGAIDADAVEAAILAHRDEFRLCYEREINAETPNISGTIISDFVIGSTGNVGKAGVGSSTLGNANIEGCVIRVLKRIHFPLPNGAGIVEVKYPFKFAARK